MAKKQAFTLAEILITLGIIGVVAILAIQPLIANIREKSTVKKVTQAYALLQQVDLAMREEHGNYDTWNFDDNEPNFVEEFKKHVEVATTCKNMSKECPFFSQFSYPYDGNLLILKNGLIIGFRYRDKCNEKMTVANYNKGNLSSNCAGINVAVNGPKKTVRGTDVFHFRFATDGVIPWGKIDGWGSFNGFAGCPNVGGSYISDTCTAWVVYNQNMDYLHCRSKLSWAGAHSCKDANNK